MKKSKIKYVFIFSIVGIVLNFLLEFYIDYSFNLTSCINCLSTKMVSGGKIGSFSVIPNRGIEIIRNILYINPDNNSINGINNIIRIVLLLFLLVIALKIIISNKNKLNKMSITYYSLFLIGVIGNITNYRYLILYNMKFNMAILLLVLGLILLVIDMVINRVGKS